MNIEDLLIGFEHLSNFGITLSSEKRLVIYNSLLILRNDAQFNKIFLWGFLRGLSLDYHIAYGYKKNAINRTFYYSLNGLDWLLLPQPNTKDIQYATMCSARFQGDPKFAVQLDLDDPFITDLDKKQNLLFPELQAELDVVDLEMNQNEPKVIDAIKVQGKLKEEDRLAAIIQMINEEAVVIPRGALYKRHDGLIVDNEAFEGLTLTEGDEMRSYLHYRLPQQQWNTNILTRHDYNYGVDFLDTIDSDVPEGLWIMRLFDGNKTIFLQHLSWPGYIFCHIIKTPLYFSFYCGNGKKNHDVPFML